MSGSPEPGGSAGKSSAMVKAKGAAVTLPGPVGPAVFFDATRDIVVQLANHQGGCWGGDCRRRAR